MFYKISRSPWTIKPSEFPPLLVNDNDIKKWLIINGRSREFKISEPSTNNRVSWGQMSNFIFEIPTKFIVNCQRILHKILIFSGQWLQTIAIDDFMDNFGIPDWMSGSIQGAQNQMSLSGHTSLHWLCSFRNYLEEAS